MPFIINKVITNVLVANGSQITIKMENHSSLSQRDINRRVRVSLFNKTAIEQVLHFKMTSSILSLSFGSSYKSNINVQMNPLAEVILEGGS